LLSSQGADASFVLTLAGFPPGASFVLALFLRFRLYQIFSDPISSVLSRFSLSRFPFGGHYVSGFPLRFIIEPRGLNSGMPNWTPSG
ncbi:hypothetical protein, partial [Streptomyces sp. NPDC002054]|uniref:hypothetical protein n=1 Tax=Streptomyces sp. NPDC002054 TaxID=3154663 RepID=UPI0033213669